MIITRTPYRISLFGGSTDYPEYFKEFESLVVGFTIDKYIYVSLRPNYKIFDYKSRITYAHIEDVQDNKEVQNPGVRGTLEYFDITNGVCIGIQGDLPARTGMGSSSALVVGLSKAIDSQLNKRGLAKAAISIERGLLKEPGGIQDQIWAAYGGANSIYMYKDEFIVRPLPVSREFLDEFKKHLVLCHTGFSRDSFDIASSHTNIKVKHEIRDLAEYGYRYICAESIENVGKLLHESWLLKRNLSHKISSDRIDSLYEQGLANGAIGGKLLGAGSNGFLLFILDTPNSQQQFCDSLKLTPIEFNYSDNGSEIITR